jgi:hypothetical protein
MAELREIERQVLAAVTGQSSSDKLHPRELD